jgi:hypothetical protein
MKKLTATIFAIVLYFACVNAQTSIQIMDILVSPVMVIDTVTNLPVESDGETLLIMCKINELTNAASISLLIGTTQNTGDVLTAQAQIVSSGDDYLLIFNNESLEVSNNVIAFTIELNSQQNQQYNFVSLFVTDVDEQESNHLIFTK